MVSLKEQLGELISQARHVGYLEAEANNAEHDAEVAPKGSRARAQRKARGARQIARIRSDQLDVMHERLLERLSSSTNTGGQAQGCVSAPEEG